MARVMLILAAVVAGAMLVIFVWVVVTVIKEGRATRAAIESGFVEDEARSGAATTRVLERMARQARRDRLFILINLREILRQLGGDPARLSPVSSDSQESSGTGGPSGSSGSREDNGNGTGGNGNGRPRPRPSPSPSDPPIACAIVLGERVCVEDPD